MSASCWEALQAVKLLMGFQPWALHRHSGRSPHRAAGKSPRGCVLLQPSAERGGQSVWAGVNSQLPVTWEG